MLIHFFVGSRQTTSATGTTAQMASYSDKAVPSVPTREVQREVGSKTIHATREILPVSPDAALSNSNSPANSHELEKNQEWARKFPDEALAWLQTAPQGEQRVAVAEVVCPDLVLTNPLAALTLAENSIGNATNNVVENLLGNLAQQWALQDMQAATGWALARTPGEQRDRFLQRIAFVESQTNPEEAARLIVEKMSPGPTQNEAAISVLYQWAQVNAGAALAWAESFPAGDLRDRAIAEVKNVTAVSSGSQTQGANTN